MKDHFHGFHGWIQQQPRMQIVQLNSAASAELDTDIGPVLSSKKRALVEGFVNKMGGKRVLQRVLIANNGMAATKAILSMRQWAYMVLGEFIFINWRNWSCFDFVLTPLCLFLTDR